MSTRNADITLKYQPKTPIMEVGDVDTYVEATIQLNATVHGPDHGHFDVEVGPVDRDLTHIKVTEIDGDDNETLIYEGRLSKFGNALLAKTIETQLFIYADQDAVDTVLEKVLFARAS